MTVTQINRIDSITKMKTFKPIEFSVMPYHYF